MVQQNMTTTVKYIWYKVIMMTVICFGGGGDAGHGGPAHFWRRDSARPDPPTNAIAAIWVGGRNGGLELGPAYKTRCL